MRGGAAGAAAATLFMIAFYEFFNLVGALNSSPWTAESFGGDPGKAESARKYVRHAIVCGSAASGVGAVIARSWMPVIGTGLAAGYTYYLYEGALNKAQASGSVSFQSPSGQGWKKLSW
jgi:hypothetical protein